MKPALLGLISLTFIALVLVCAAYYSGPKLYQGFLDKMVSEGGNTIVGETNSRGTFTLYYADWCPHCKTIKPVFRDFMGDGTLTVNDAPIKVRMVEEKRIQKGVDPAIQGYPTLLYSDASGKTVEFSGPRTPDGFMEFLKGVVLG
jgi:thiol-disulfide isomerase/thioredoxin